MKISVDAVLFEGEGRLTPVAPSYSDGVLQIGAERVVAIEDQAEIGVHWVRPPEHELPESHWVLVARGHDGELLNLLFRLDQTEDLKALLVAIFGGLEHKDRLVVSEVFPPLWRRLRRVVLGLGVLFCVNMLGHLVYGAPFSRVFWPEAGFGVEIALMVAAAILAWSSAGRPVHHHRFAAVEELRRFDFTVMALRAAR